VGAAVVTAGGLPGSEARKARRHRAARVPHNDPRHGVMPTHASVDLFDYGVAAKALAALVAVAAAGARQWAQPERYPHEDPGQAAMPTADRQGPAGSHQLFTQAKAAFGHLRERLRVRPHGNDATTSQ